MLCDRCNGDTKQKEITSKKDGKKYTLFECLEGCKNGKFAYSFFPPKQRGDGKTQPAKPAPSNGSGSEAITVLRSIDTTLKNMLQIMQAKSRMIPVQNEELQPDDEIPF